MKMRATPKRPVRGTEKVIYKIDDGFTLDDIIKFFADMKLHPGEAYFLCDFDYYNETVECCFIIEHLENDASFDKKMTRYGNEMQKYNEWRNQNKQAIEQELVRRQTLVEEKRRRTEKKLEKNLEKNLEKCRKRALRELTQIEKRFKKL